MEEKPTPAVPTLTKPIVNLFNGEFANAKYRQYISDPVNLHAAKHDFVQLIDDTIAMYEKINPHVMDSLPGVVTPKGPPQYTEQRHVGKENSIGSTM